MSIMRKIVGISIGLFIAGILLPVSLVALANANFTGVDPAVKTIVVVLLPILAVVAIIYGFMGKSEGE